MRIKRYKKTQRVIGFFEKNFGFRKPFQIIVDGTFAQAALQTKVNIREQIPKYLDGEVKLFTTSCAVIEIEKIGQEVYGALQILKYYPLHKCGHEEAHRASSCIASLVKPNNPNHFIVATQDITLRERLRKTPGVALLYLHGNAPALEKPSEKSIKYADTKNQEKLAVGDYQKEVIGQLKKEAFGVTSKSSVNHVKKRKHKSGPNPLSCKKPKKSTVPRKNTTSALTGVKVKSKRKRTKGPKIPKHVKEAQRTSV